MVNGHLGMIESLLLSYYGCALTPQKNHQRGG